MNERFWPAAMWSMVAAAVVLSGCSTKKGGQRTLPAPSFASAFGLVDPNTFVVLGGEPRSRGLTLIDAQSGAIKGSFGVTGEADALTIADDGSLILGIAGENESGASVGALEFWSKNGKKGVVIGMPAAVADLSEQIDNKIYALVGSRTSRAVVTVDVGQKKIVGTLAVQGDVQQIAVCRFDLRNYLLQVKSAGGMVARDLSDTATGAEITIKDPVKAPACATALHSIFVISSAFASKTVDLMSFPSTLTSGSHGIPLNAIRLHVMPDQELAVLNNAGAVSSIDVLPAAFFRSATTAPIPK